MGLQKWREERCAKVTLPSGLVVLYLKSVSLLDILMAMDGDVPAPLAGVVNEIIAGKDVTIGVQDFAKMAPLVNGLVKVALVEPPVADEPSETHLEITELPATDRMFLFNLLNEGKKLSKFREEPDGDVDSVQPVDGVPDEAERVPEAGPGVVGGVPV